MREVIRSLLPRRAVGRPALEKRLRGLVIATNRFAQRADAGPADQVWAGRVIATLRELVR